MTIIISGIQRARPKARVQMGPVQYLVFCSTPGGGGGGGPPKKKGGVGAPRSPKGGARLIFGFFVQPRGGGGNSNIKVAGMCLPVSQIRGYRY